MNGFDLCRKIHSGGYKLPILMLTAGDEEADKVLLKLLRRSKDPIELSVQLGENEEGEAYLGVSYRQLPVPFRLRFKEGEHRFFGEGPYGYFFHWRENPEEESDENPIGNNT